MRKTITVLAGAACVLLAIGGTVAAKVLSERGDQALDAISPDTVGARQKTIYARPTRPWASAPPTIPHKNKAYTVTLDYNVCMSCHVSNYQRMKAPKPTVSHFIIRAGQVDHSKIDGRRYFCRQCHVPQANIKPLVPNTFTNVALVAPPKTGSKSKDQYEFGEYLAGECMGCHTYNKTIGGIRGLAGWEKKAMVHVLKAYKDELIQNKAMVSVAKILSDEEMDAIGVYFAALTRREKK